MQANSPVPDDGRLDAMVGGDLAVPGADHAPATLLGSCGANPGVTCRLVWDLSHDMRAAQLTDNFLAGPVHLLLRIAFVVVLAFLIRAIIRRVINRLTERATQSLLPQLRGGAASRLVSVRLSPRRRGRSGSELPVPEAPVPDEADAFAESAPVASTPVDSAADSPVDGPVDSAADSAADRAGSEAERGLVDERRKQRVRALGSILINASSVIIFSIAGVVVLGDLGINLAPLLASAGVVGIAVGFGAQNLVRDYLSGIFMMVEDQYGVGDVITIGDATGSVENVTLRITRMRDVNGIVWHIRNGAIEQVGNESQGWARAVIDYPVPYQPDLATIRSVLAEAAQALWDDPIWRAVMLEPPEIWGAQEISSTAVTMRIVVKTAPLRQWGSSGNCAPGRRRRSTRPAFIRRPRPPAPRRHRRRGTTIVRATDRLAVL
jgi:small-conductance mechanosensitive channel